MTEKLITATVYVLLHSLWQGLIIAAVLSAFTKFSKRTSSGLKYSVSFVSLIGVVLSSAATFIYYLKESAVVTAAGTYMRSGLYPAAGKSADTVASLTDSFESYSGLLFSLWFSGMTVFFIKFCVDLYYADMLRKKDCVPVSEKTLTLFMELAEKMGITKTVRFLESPIASVPAVIGYFKPAVIIPLGLVMKIPSDQLEAVISHELAHIVRNDFMHNLIQSVIEIVYFFNPSVLWLSKTIRTERENACDDLALTQCKDPALLARGLYSLGLLNTRMPGPVLAASGSSNNLLCRIKRIITKENDMARTYSGFVASIIVMLLTLAVITSCSLFAGTKDEVKEEQVKTVIVKDDGSVKNENVIIVKKRSDDGKEMTMDVTVEDDDCDEAEKKITIIKNDDGTVTRKVIVTKGGEDCDEIMIDGGKKMIFISDDDEDIDIDIDLDLDGVMEALEKALESIDKKDLTDEQKAETEAKVKEAIDKIKEKEFRAQAKVKAAAEAKKAKKIIVRSEASTEGKETAVIIKDGVTMKLDGDKLYITGKDGKVSEIDFEKDPKVVQKKLEELGLGTNVKYISRDGDDVMIWNTSDENGTDGEKIKKIRIKIEDDGDGIEIIKKIDDKDIDQLWKNLIADGIFKEKSDETKIEIDDDEIEINGKEIPDKLLDKYKKLLGVTKK